jgi:hypothetical protein
MRELRRSHQYSQGMNAPPSHSNGRVLCEPEEREPPEVGDVTSLVEWLVVLVALGGGFLVLLGLLAG